MFFIAALATGAAAYNATTTVEAKVYTTIACSTPTTFAYGNQTYTVTEATTLTVEDCSCTIAPHKPSASAVSTPSSQNAPPLANGAVAGKVGAAAGVAAAVAYLL